jgi:hypothetical protein
MAKRGDELLVTEDGLTLPAEDVLTGRGFVTGKSGSGKSNTASVLVEELLEKDAPLLIIDTDGEYYGLKEEYEVLHLGASDRADAVVEPSDAEAIADLALAEGVPIVLDVSGFLEGDTADRLVYEVSKHLFSQARDVRQPFLLLVEEVHEFVPEQGGLDDVGEMLVRVAKRGRKRGLGLCGLSQRPASVDKDFITQCDWIAWHRLTWANDTRVVDTILGGNYSTDVETLDDGEAFLMADWEQSVQRVQFRRKRTFDAGATPGFGESSSPDLKAIDPAWVERFQTESGEAAEDNDDLKRAEPAEPAPAADGPGDNAADAGSDAVDEDESGDSASGSDSSGSAKGSSSGGEGGSDGQSSPASGSGSARGSTSGTPTKTRSSDPTADPQSAIWELGQLVAHVGRVGARKTTRGLSAVGLFSARTADDGLRALGQGTRALGNRAVHAVEDDGESASPVAPTSDDMHKSGSGETEPKPVTDRLLGFGVAAAIVLGSYGAFALV